MSDGQEVLEGADIAQLLKSSGPIVKCVILRSEKTNDEEEADKKPSALEKEDSLNHKKIILDLLEEVEIDTTPSKSMVEKVLGGPFTFLGQYEEEGVVLMVRNIQDETPLEEQEIASKQLSELRSLCKEREIDMTLMVEKSDLVRKLVEDSRLPPINPHTLQPPLHKTVVRGDILVLKVAETKEELDENEGDSGDENKNVKVLTNEEFFLDYTKEEYIKFASRTDIEEYEISQEEEPKEETDDDDSDEEGVAYVMGDDGEIGEEDKSACFNLVMNEVLRQYREENGRGPNTQELLDLRATIAKELDVEVAHVKDADWNKKAKESSTNSERRIGFHEKDRVLEYHPDPAEHDHHNRDEDFYIDDDEHSFEEGEGNDLDDEGREASEPPRKRLKTEAPDFCGEDASPAANETGVNPLFPEEEKDGDPTTSDQKESAGGANGC